MPANDQAFSSSTTLCSVTACRQGSLLIQGTLSAGVSALAVDWNLHIMDQMGRVGSHAGWLRMWGSQHASRCSLVMHRQFGTENKWPFQICVCLWFKEHKSMLCDNVSLFGFFKNIHWAHILSVSQTDTHSKDKHTHKHTHTHTHTQTEKHQYTP